MLDFNGILYSMKLDCGHSFAHSLVMFDKAKSLLIRYLIDNDIFRHISISKSSRIYHDWLVGW